ncbi:MAG TPA: hypothetical protein VGM78_02185, partial [Ilumatobacteraceae bacterium]
MHVFVGAALAAAAVTSVGLIQAAGAAEGGSVSSFVPITPCRLLDTRPSTAIGPRTTPIGPAETYATAVWGTNGNCAIP